MTVSELRDIYTDFLIVQTDKASATACSDLLDNTISHDKFSRLLSRSDFNSQFLWEQNKSFIRKHQNSNGVLSLDNSILHKPHSTANEIINYHYDHGVGKVVKGINLLTALIEYDDVTIPIGYEVLTKDLFCVKEAKNGKEKFARKSRYSINELARKLVKQVKLNGIQFSHLTGDTWFASKDNLRFFAKEKIKFVLAMSSNRLVALDRKSFKSENYVNLSKLELNDGQSRKVYLKDIPFPVVITHKVFKNGDASTGELYLVTNDLNLSGDHIYTIYQRRWKIEEYHRSIKQNTSVCKSPTKVQKTQLNHLCLSLLAYSNLEQLKVASDNNHYAIKRKLFISANQASYEKYREIKMEYKMAS